MTKTRFLLEMLLGAAIGLLMAVVGIDYWNWGQMDTRDCLPLMLALVYLLTALTVWINPYIRKTAQPGERLWKRALTALLSALALAAPALVPKSVNPDVAYALIVVIYLASLLMAHRLIMELDELTKRVVADTNTVTLSVLLAGFFLYGAAERMGFLGRGVSIWTLNSVVLWFQFTATQIAWMRRGLGNPLVPEE